MLCSSVVFVPLPLRTSVSRTMVSLESAYEGLSPIIFILGSKRGPHGLQNSCARAFIAFAVLCKQMTLYDHDGMGHHSHTGARRDKTRCTVFHAPQYLQA